jgi:hypothetical protein
VGAQQAAAVVVYRPAQVIWQRKHTAPHVASRHTNHDGTFDTPSPYTHADDYRTLSHPSPASNLLFIAANLCLFTLLQGHYCPAVANKVYRTSELGQGPPINLKGVAIGNGLTKPSVQYGAYADYALQEGLISQGVSEACSFCGNCLTVNVRHMCLGAAM